MTKKAIVPVVRKRDEANSAVDERGVNIHEEKVHLPGAIEPSGTCEQIIWHESDLMAFEGSKL
ncbi:MAG TPA: hypothetical protein VI320_40265 [Terracidiphilus sp.]|jgi:hypothetical protein